jgi:hypothetical protein
LERLQYLLRVYEDIYAEDAEGRTIFDHVDSFKHAGPIYVHDLWYCALQRVGINVSSHHVQRPRNPLYGAIGYGRSDYDCIIYDYTPEHYHALKHLPSWNDDNFRSQMDRLLQEIPLNEEEARLMESLPWNKRKQREQRERIRFMCPNEWISDDDCTSEEESEELP